MQYQKMSPSQYPEYHRFLMKKSLSKTKGPCIINTTTALLLKIVQLMRLLFKAIALLKIRQQILQAKGKPKIHNRLDTTYTIDPRKLRTNTTN